MAEKNKSTSFVQFKYCFLCKISHTHKNKKHIYSCKHQEILNSILNKYRKKIDECRIFLKTPQIQKFGWEKDACIWCYFCAESVHKHSSQDDHTVVNSDFFNHLSLSEHYKKMNDFFWENIINKKKKEFYIIREDELKKFHDKVREAVDIFKQEQNRELILAAGKLKQQEIRQKVITQHYYKLNQHVKPIRQTDQIRKDVAQTYNSDQTDSLKMNRSNSFGLTVIPRLKGNKEKGNVFTGAVPPWLQDNREEDNMTIGPTVSDFEKYLKHEKKKKLPENRVGANFNQETASSSTWLPSFGGVWSNQRRLNNKYQFERRMKLNSDIYLDKSVELKDIKPYKRQKTETVTSDMILTPEIISSSFDKRQTTINNSLRNVPTANVCFSSNICVSSEIICDNLQDTTSGKKQRNDFEDAGPELNQESYSIPGSYKGKNSIIQPLSFNQHSNVPDISVHQTLYSSVNKKTKTTNNNPYNIEIPNK